MVKLASISTILLGAIAGFATADSCKNGLTYCGYNLLHKGNYYGEIVAELQKKGQGVDPAHIQQSTFACYNDGWIAFDRYCYNGCKDGGHGKSDSCN